MSPVDTFRQVPKYHDSLRQHLDVLPISKLAYGIQLGKHQHQTKTDIRLPVGPIGMLHLPVQALR
jgi:hypothetical protein